MNRIGDLGLLIGIFLIATQTNALDYLSVAQNASKFEFDGVVIMFITLSLFIGAMGKICTNSFIYLASRCNGLSYSSFGVNSMLLQWLLLVFI